MMGMMLSVMFEAWAVVLRSVVLVVRASALIHRLWRHFMHLRVVLLISLGLLHLRMRLVLAIKMFHTGTSVHCVTSKDGHHDEHSQHFLCLHNLFRCVDFRPSL